MTDMHGLKPNVWPNTPYNVTAQIRGDIREIVQREIEQVTIGTIGAETPAGAQEKVDTAAASLTAAIAAAKAELQAADALLAPLVHTHDERYYLKAQVDSSLAGKAATSHIHDDRYYTESEVDAALAGKAATSHSHNEQYYTEAEIDTALAGKANTSHTHDDRYYTEAQTNDLLATKAGTGHTHDERYFTEAEVTAALAGKAPLIHDHNDRYYTEAEIDTALAGKANISHNHDDRYYTEAEIDTMLENIEGGGVAGVTSVDGETGAVSLSSTYAPLPTGTPDGTKYLRDDNSWQAVPGGTASTGVTADDTPAAPAEGASATYFVTSAVSWPAGLTWSTDPDGDVAPTITGTALVSMFTYGGVTRAVLGATFPALPAAPDTTDPTAGTLDAVMGAYTADLTVTGATDETALAATPYAFTMDAGATWTAYQSGATYQYTSLTPETSYTFRHKVKDAAGNETLGTAVTDTTDAAPSDTTPPTAGTLASSSITDTTFTLTVSGASDETALDAAPYSFSTDNGSTWTAYQASASLAVTGMTAETAYTCQHRVKDAAGNVATGTAITVTTTAASIDPLDAFSWEWRFEADSITGLADTDPVATWPDTSGNSRDATQATAGNRPTWDADAFGTIGGVKFTASTAQSLTTAAITALSQPTTIWLVQTIAEAATGNTFDGLTTTNRHATYRQGETDYLFAGLSPNGNGIQGFGVVAIVFNGASSAVYRPNGTKAVGLNVGTHTLTGLTIGNRFANAESSGRTLGALLAINAAQSLADINTVGAALADKYGFTWTEAT